MSIVPFLAFLFDKMMHRIITPPLTAEDALRFLEWVKFGIPDVDLHTAIKFTNEPWRLGSTGIHWSLLSS